MVQQNEMYLDSEDPSLMDGIGPKGSRVYEGYIRPSGLSHDIGHQVAQIGLLRANVAESAIQVTFNTSWNGE